MIKMVYQIIEAKNGLFNSVGTSIKPFGKK